MERVTTTRRLTTIGASVFVAVLLVEIGLQCRRSSLFPPPAPEALTLFRKSNDPLLIYEMTPNAEARVNGVRYATNSAGFRDDEFADPPPPDAAKLLLIGDSVAMGLGVPMQQAFPQVLEKLTNDGSTNVQPSFVYNLAVVGYSTEQEIRLLETRGLALKPDRILWSYVLNDPDTMDGGLAFYFSAPKIELPRIASAALSKSTHLVNNYRHAMSRQHDYYQFIHDRYADRTEAQFDHLGRIQEEAGTPIHVIVSPVFGYVPGEPYPWAHIDARIREGGVST